MNKHLQPTIINMKRLSPKGLRKAFAKLNKRLPFKNTLYSKLQKKTKGNDKELELNDLNELLKEVGCRVDYEKQTRQSIR